MEFLIVTMKERDDAPYSPDLVLLRSALTVRAWLQEDADDTDYLDGPIQGGTDDADMAVGSLLDHFNPHRDDMPSSEIESVFEVYDFYGFWIGDDGHEKSLETLLAVEKAIEI
jgi:hypothetical protein